MRRILSQVKPKKCKGIGKASEYGCGKEVLKRVNGLCQSCYGKYLSNDTGKIERAIEKARRIRDAANKKIEKERKVELMSTTAYWSKIVQPIINEIARLIDRGLPCISSGTFPDVAHGGHYISVGANRTLSLNLHNIHLQSVYSNHFKAGDNIAYRQGLINRYGEEYVQFVEGLQKCPVLRLSKSDLIQVKEKAQAVRNQLKTTVFANLEERVAARNIANDLIGVYPMEFSAFTGGIDKNYT